MSLVNTLSFETPLVLWHSLDGMTPDLPSAVRVYLCENSQAVAESWSNGEGVVVIHSSTYSEALLRRLDYLAQAVPDAPVVVMLNFPDMRMERLLASGVQEIVVQVTDLIPAIRKAATRKSRERAMQTARHYDALTDLPNRVLFQDRLEHALASHKRSKHPMGLVILDVSRVSHPDEAYEHSLHDAAIETMANRLRNVTRNSDTLARIGPNTFALIAQNLRQTRNLSQVCDKLASQLRRPMTYNGESITLTGCVGAGLAGESDFDANTLMLHAENALAGARQVGGNNYMIYNARSAEDRIRSGLEKAIYHALEHHQITMAYQPQVSMDGRTLYGVEAFMRWDHPVFGQVPPAQFIPLLESTGLIETFGLWALKASCQQFRDWLESGLMPDSARVSVNLSARQFHQPDLADQVLNTLDEVGLAGRHLTLEITETMLMEGSEHTADALARLRFENIAIAIDDFGTGYSSLSDLKTLPVDYLKIDHDFTRSVGTDDSDKAIAGSIIHLAHSLKLKVIAEGVEQAGAQAVLSELGCDEFQGNLFSAPLGAEKMPAVLSRCA
jgi:diguanylate cyclase (GGDEF)-like protein